MHAYSRIGLAILSLFTMTLCFFLQSSRGHITRVVLEQFLSFAKYLDGLTHGAPLLKQLCDHILFNAAIWIHTPAKVSSRRSLSPWRDRCLACDQAEVDDHQELSTTDGFSNPLRCHCFCKDEYWNICLGFIGNRAGNVAYCPVCITLASVFVIFPLAQSVFIGSIVRKQSSCEIWLKMESFSSNIFLILMRCKTINCQRILCSFTWWQFVFGAQLTLTKPLPSVWGVEWSTCTRYILKFIRHYKVAQFSSCFHFPVVNLTKFVKCSRTPPPF